MGIATTSRYSFRSVEPLNLPVHSQPNIRRLASEIVNSKLAFWFALLLAAGGLVKTSRAQPVYYTLDSLDLRVARAEFIFTGTISNCTATFTDRPGDRIGGSRQLGIRRPEGAVRYTITVSVGEVLKGKPARTIDLFQETSVDDKRFDQWAKKHTLFLWFGAPASAGGSAWSNLRGIDLDANSWSTIRLGAPVPSESTYTSDSPVYTMEFERVTDPKDILARVRKAAKQKIDPVEIHNFKTIWSAEPPSPFASLAVPICPNLEKLARRMVHSPEEFTSRRMTWTPTNAEQMVAYRNASVAERASARAAGIGALRYFKSKGNINEIKPFLNDTNSMDYQDPSGRKWREFYVRKAAFETLQGWSVQIQEPVLREDLQ
jgi:hypothetical protein